MNIIDMNVAIGMCDVHGKELMASGLLAMMQDYGITHAVAYHEAAKSDHRAGNAEMMRIAGESEGRIGFCAVLDPALGAESLPGEGTLAQRLAASGAECIRVFPSEMRVLFHPFYFEEILTAAKALSMPILIDDHLAARAELFARLPEMAASYPEVKFVLVRYGICNIRHILPLATKCQNVYFTVEKMLDYLQIEEICERGGGDKLLFGTGYPALPPAGAMGLVLYADVAQEQKQRIFEGNWEEIRYDHS